MISVVVPVHSKGETLTELISNIRKGLSEINNYEIIFIHDSGPEQSWKIIENIQNTYPDQVRAFRLDKNRGQHIATYIGLKKALGDYIFTIDEDGQHDPQYLVAMKSALDEKNIDLLYAKFLKTEQSLFKRIFSPVLRRILSIFIPDLPEEYSSYRLIRSALVKKLDVNIDGTILLDAELGRKTKEYSSILINHSRRLSGKSSYTISKLVNQSIDVLFKYSRKFRIIFNVLLFIDFLACTVLVYQIISGPKELSLITGLLSGLLLFLILIKERSISRIKLIS